MDSGSIKNIIDNSQTCDSTPLIMMYDVYDSWTNLPTSYYGLKNVIKQYTTKKTSYSDKQLIVLCSDMTTGSWESQTQNNYKVLRNDFSGSIGFSYSPQTERYFIQSSEFEFLPSKTKIEFYRYGRDGLDETQIDKNYYIYSDFMFETLWINYPEYGGVGFEYYSNVINFNIGTFNRMLKNDWKYVSQDDNYFLFVITEFSDSDSQISTHKTFDEVCASASLHIDSSRVSFEKQLMLSTHDMNSSTWVMNTGSMNIWKNEFNDSLIYGMDNNGYFIQSLSTEFKPFKIKPEFYRHMGMLYSSDETLLDGYYDIEINIDGLDINVLGIDYTTNIIRFRILTNRDTNKTEFESDTPDTNHFILILTQLLGE